MLRSNHSHLRALLHQLEVVAEQNVNEPAGQRFFLLGELPLRRGSKDLAVPRFWCAKIPAAKLWVGGWAVHLNERRRAGELGQNGQLRFCRMD